MSKTKIEFPGMPLSKFRIPVRITDLNYGNHVGNDSFVSLLHETRVQWLSVLGFSEINIGGPGLIMRDIEVNFLKEAFYKDMIEAEITTGNISKASFDIFYRLSAIREDKIVPVAIARTGMVAFSYQEKRISTLPGEFTNAIQRRLL